MADDPLEELLNRALKTYSAAEPLGGIDERLMRRVRGASKSKSWLSWTASATVAVALSMLLVIVSAPRKTVIQPTRTVAIHAPRMSVPSTTTSIAAVRRPRKTARHWAKPKLSQEEWLLIRLVQSHPEQAAKSLQNTDLADIKIDPIEVEPLETR